MGFYEHQITKDLRTWQRQMQAAPSLLNRLTKGTQERINNLIPEKVHQIVTAAIKHMTRAVFAGADFTTPKPGKMRSLEEIELKVGERIKFYSSAAAAEGAVTGFGGILLGLADFPLWLTLKIKMMFEMAALYGYDTRDYKERIYILHIFQLTFSSQEHRNHLYSLLSNWETEKDQLPTDINQFDWKSFQLEYRDYIDLAKLLQLIPVVGAPVGAFVNHRLTKKLGKYAMNCYRMRCREMFDVPLRQGQGG